MSKPGNVLVDPILLPFLQAPGDEEADRVLAHLILQHADPVVKNIVGYKFRVYFRDNNRAQSDDAEDIYSETVISLLTRLTDLRGNPQLEAIRDFRSYVAVTSYRACYEHLRRKYPQRFSLKNKLRYFFKHQQGFTLLENDKGEWLGGFSEWQEKPRADSRQLTQLQDHFAEFEREMLPGGTAVGTSLNDLLTGIFRSVGSTIELDDLVGIVAEAWGIRDQPPREESDQQKPPPVTLDERRGVEDEVTERALLGRLWGEIVNMSRRHCAALLLNLKDDRGGSALDLFLFTGVASFQQIAAAIGETEEWLAEMWNHLPLEDTAIAERLGLIRQQVINLRKTARLRLAKYMSNVGT
jgi:DNA-directed RNA polymerase specialized sigma24 family protein